MTFAVHHATMYLQKGDTSCGYSLTLDKLKKVLDKPYKVCYNKCTKYKATDNTSIGENKLKKVLDKPYKVCYNKGTK